MRSLLPLTLLIISISAKTVVWVTPGSTFRVVVTWDSSLVPDSSLLPLINSFFYAYPKMVSKYNPNAAKDITWTFDSNYKGVAETGGTNILFSTDYFGSKSDAGVSVHESMHIVQSYPSFPNSVVWLTEGIADYVRDEFSHDGFNYNSDDKWSLPAYSPDQSYTQGYRVTAAFLKYLEKYYPGIVVRLDSEMRSATYSVDTWKSITGKTLDELWTQYGNDSNNAKRRRRSLKTRVIEQKN